MPIYSIRRGSLLIAFVASTKLRHLLTPWNQVSDLEIVPNIRGMIASSRDACYLPAHPFSNALMRGEIKSIVRMNNVSASSWRCVCACMLACAGEAAQELCTCSWDTENLTKYDTFVALPPHVHAHRSRNGILQHIGNLTC